MRKITRPDCPNFTALSGGDYKHPDNKDALQSASHGKCMYCESSVLHISYGDVEHIKPKSRYPQLEFDWLNLGFVCSKCNGTKRDKYSEEQPFINPYDEDPDLYLVATGATLWGKTDRGKHTIVEIGLNRVDLLERRKEKLKVIQSLINAWKGLSSAPEKECIRNLIEELAHESKEHSLCIKSIVDAELQ